MKKKLLTSAAIASFLTAAGVVIPQTDIFAADTPNPSTLENTPHPSTVPSAQPSSPQPGSVEYDRGYNAGKDILEAQNKKKVESFADYWIESIAREKNLLTVKTKNNANVEYIHYFDEENLPTAPDHTPNAQILYPLENSTKNIYYFDTSKIVSGENSNRKYVLNEIMLATSKEDLKSKYFITNRYDKKGNKLEEQSVATNGAIYLDYKDLHKYYDLTRVVGSKAIEHKELTANLGDKDYAVYTDKTHVAPGGTIKITVKYKNGVKKYSDDMFRKFIGSLNDGTQVFENNYYFTSDILKYTTNDDNTDESKETISANIMNNAGEDIFYLNVGKLTPGYYHLTKLFGLDLTKGNIENADFIIDGSGSTVYRTESNSTKPILEPTPTPQPEKPSEMSKPGKEETLKPSETPKPGKEETLKPSETPKPGKEETLKPSETPKPGKEEALKPSETPKGDKKEMPKPEKDNNWNPFAQGQKAKEGSTEVKSEAGEVETKPVSNRKEGKVLPNTGLQTTSYGFLAAIVGLFGAVALRRKNR